jgi:Kef-type K+ transport system membrane component KefB
MDQIPALWMTLVGAAVAAATLLNALLRRLGLPSLVGYILLGFGLRLLDGVWPVLSPPVETAFDFLASMGLVVLLFRVGLESHPGKLLRQLPPALFIWAGNFALSGLAGYLAARLWLGLDLIPSLAAAAALTATSVGVSVAAWKGTRTLESRRGRLLLNVAELDDITAVITLGLLLAVIPILRSDGGGSALWGTLGTEALVFLGKFLLFAAGCLVFARFAEGRVVAMSARIEPGSGLMLTVLGLGLIIAAAAGWLGFSLAIGALFAGLVFSRDPKAVQTDARFTDIYAFFAPFFFIGIGLDLDPASLAQGAGFGAVLLVAALAGKLIGTGLPAWPIAGRGGALLIAVSMVPRAEIAMVIMHQGKAMGPEVVPEALYAGMVLTVAVTCVLAPVILRPLLRRRAGDPDGE